MQANNTTRQPRPEARPFQVEVIQCTGHRVAGSTVARAAEVYVYARVRRLAQPAGNAWLGTVSWFPAPGSDWCPTASSLARVQSLVAQCALARLGLLANGDSINGVAVSRLR